MDMKIVIFAMLAVLGCSKPAQEIPLNRCGYTIEESDLIIYEQICDTLNVRNVGEPVCIQGNIISECSKGGIQVTIKEVLR